MRICVRAEHHLLAELRCSFRRCPRRSRISSRSCRRVQMFFSGVPTTVESQNARTGRGPERAWSAFFRATQCETLTPQHKGSRLYPVQFLPKTHCLLKPFQHTLRLPSDERCIMATSILTISRNESLQNTRALVLEQAGYHVVTALSDKDALGLMGVPNSFSLVLLCHSVPETSRVFLMTEIKTQNPNLPILMLYNGYESTRARVDGSIHNLDSPERLVEMIGFLTKHVEEPRKG